MATTKTVLTLLAPAIRTGTVLVFDEWCGYEGWEQHEARAWSEFCNEHAVGFEWLELPPAGGKAAAAGDSRAVVVTRVRTKL